MTVAELIEQLSQIENKSLEVRTWNQAFGTDIAVTSVKVFSQRKSVGFKNERIEEWVDIK